MWFLRYASGDTDRLIAKLSCPPTKGEVTIVEKNQLKQKLKVQKPVPLSTRKLPQYSTTLPNADGFF